MLSRPPLGLRRKSVSFFSVGSFRAREPSCGSWVCAKTGRKRGARRLRSLERPGRCSWLPPLPLSLAAVRLHLPPPHLAAPGSRSPASPDAGSCPGPIPGQSLGETPTQLFAPSRTGGGGSSSQPPRHVPESSLPGAWASWFIQPETSSHLRRSSRDAAGAQGHRLRRRGTFTHLRVSGDELAAGSPHLQPGSLSPTVMRGAGGKGRLEAAAAAEQLLNYSKSPPTPARICLSSLQLFCLRLPEVT